MSHFVPSCFRVFVLSCFRVEAMLGIELFSDLRKGQPVVVDPYGAESESS